MALSVLCAGGSTAEKLDIDSQPRQSLDNTNLRQQLKGLEHLRTFVETSYRGRECWKPETRANEIKETENRGIFGLQLFLSQTGNKGPLKSTEWENIL